MFVEHVLTFTTQGDADDVFSIPLNTLDKPMTLDSAMVRLTGVAGSPTAVTLDIDLTDGTTTKAALAGQSIGTAAGTVRLEPTDADKVAGTHYAPQVGASDAAWRAEVDFNFTGGTSPTVTGTLVLRWRV